MTQPVAIRAKPITYQKQRLVMKDQSGVTRRYRVVVYNREGKEISLDKVAEKNATRTVLNIITKVDLNKHTTQLTNLSLKGRKVTYKPAPKAKAIVKIVDEQTYVELSRIIKDAAPKSQVFSAPALAELPVEPVEPPYQEHQEVEIDLRKVHVKSAKSQPIITSLLNKINSGAKSLKEIQHILEEVEIKQGKLRMGRGGVKFSPSEVGMQGRRGKSQKSSVAIDFVLRQIDNVLRGKPSQQDLNCVRNIIKLLNTNSWAKNFIKNNSLTKVHINQIELDLRGHAINSDTFVSCREILDDESIRRDFLITYRSVYPSSPRLSPSEDAYLDFCNAEAEKTVTMLAQIHAQVLAQPKENNDPYSLVSIKYVATYRKFLTLIEEWLADSAINQSDYLNPRVIEIIEDILQQAPKRLQGPVLALKGQLRDRLNPSENTDFQISHPANPKSWIDECNAIKEGKIRRARSSDEEMSDYEIMVSEFANDLRVLSEIRLKTMHSSELNIDKNINNHQSYLEYLDQISQFITAEALGSVSGQSKIEYSNNMVKFFLDVQAELARQNQIDLVLTIRKGLNQTAIARLNIMDNLPKAYKTSKENFDKLASPNLEHYQKNNINAETHTLLLSSSFVKNEVSQLLAQNQAFVLGKGFNITLISRLASLKRPILEAQKNAHGGTLFFDSIGNNILEAENALIWSRSYKLRPNA